MEWLFIFTLGFSTIPTVLSVQDEQVCISMMKRNHSRFPEYINTKDGRQITVCIADNYTRYNPHFKLCEQKEVEFN